MIKTPQNMKSAEKLRSLSFHFTLKIKFLRVCETTRDVRFMKGRPQTDILMFPSKIACNFPKLPSKLLYEGDSPEI